MSLTDELRAAASTVRRILRGHGGPGRWGLLAAYVRLQLGRLLPGRGAAAGSLRLLGARWSYFSAAAMAILMDEVLVDRAYRIDLGRPDPVILDGGANIGLSVLLFKRLYPEARVTAFEPEPQTCALLERNVGDNGMKDVEIVQAALARADGTLDLHVDPHTPGNLGTSLVETPGLTGRVPVPTVRASRWIEGPVDLLKLDVEGAEHDVIEELAEAGSLALIQRIVMEYHHHMTPGDDRLGELLSRLESAGFGYHLLARHTLPFRAGEFQSMLLYAYREPTRPLSG